MASGYQPKIPDIGNIDADMADLEEEMDYLEGDKYSFMPIQEDNAAASGMSVDLPIKEGNALSLKQVERAAALKAKRKGRKESAEKSGMSEAQAHAAKVEALRSLGLPEDIGEAMRAAKMSDLEEKIADLEKEKYSFMPIQGDNAAASGMSADAARKATYRKNIRTPEQKKKENEANRLRMAESRKKDGVGKKRRIRITRKRKSKRKSKKKSKRKYKRKYKRKSKKKSKRKKMIDSYNL
jgi:hypothetical protein